MYYGERKKRADGPKQEDKSNRRLKVTPNLRGATFADFFFVKKMKVRQLRYHFRKNVSKTLKRARVIEKKRFF